MPTKVRTLGTLLYSLHSMDNIEEVTVMGKPFSAEYFKRHYSGQEISDTIQALDWAVQNRDYDFKSIPWIKDVSFSNEEIMYYIEVIREQLRKSFDQHTIDTLRIPETSRQLKILIIEDEPYRYGWLSTHFEGTQHDIKNVLFNYDDDPQTYVEFIKERFEILLLSLNHEKTILDIINKLRSFEKQNFLLPIPVLIILASPKSLVLEKFQNDNNIAHLEHPVWLSTLIKKVYDLTA